MMSFFMCRSYNTRLLTSVTTVLCICIRSIATEGAKNGLYSKGNLILMASDLSTIC